MNRTWYLPLSVWNSVGGEKPLDNKYETELRSKDRILEDKDLSWASLCSYFHLEGIARLTFREPWVLSRERHSRRSAVAAQF